MCAAIVVLDAPLIELFSGVAELERQWRGVAVGPNSIGQLELLEFSRGVVTKAVGGDTRVELAFLVAAGSNGARIARAWRDTIGRRQRESCEEVAKANRPKAEQFPTLMPPPRDMIHSLESKVILVAHFDGATVTAPKECGRSGVQGALHLATVEREASEACALAKIAAARDRADGYSAGAEEHNGSGNDSDSSNDSENGGDDRLAADGNLACHYCNGGASVPPNQMLICEMCGRGEHLACHKPKPLLLVPKGEWFCGDCHKELLPFMQRAAVGRSGGDFGAAVLQGDAGASGRGGEFIGARAVALFAAQKDVRAAALGVGELNQYVFPLTPKGGPETPLTRIGMMRPIQPGQKPRAREGGSREAWSSQGLPGVFGSIYPGKRMVQLSGSSEVQLAARDEHYDTWLQSVAMSRMLALAAAKDLGLLETKPTITAGDLFGGSAKKPSTRRTKRPRMGKHDPFVVAYSQLELALASAESVAEVLRYIKAVRMCRNREFACVHLDSSKRGFSSSMEFTFAEFAKLPHAEQWQLRHSSEPHKHEVRLLTACPARVTQ